MYSLRGDSCFNLHALVLVLYCLASNLTYYTISKILNYVHPYSPQTPQISLITSLIFTCHPIHVSVVNNITHGLTELPSYLFILLVISTHCTKERESPIVKLFFTVGGSIASMLFKETGFCVLPFLIFLSLLKEPNKSINDPYVIGLITGISIILKLRYDFTSGTEFNINPEFNYIISSENFWERVYRICLCHIKVLKLCVYMNQELSIDHNIVLSITWFNLTEVISIYTLCIIYLIWVLRKVVIKNDNFNKINLMGISTFVIFYLPSSQIIFLVGFFIAERNLFVCCLGGCLVFSNYLVNGVERFKRKRVITFTITSLIISYYSCITITSSTHWKNNKTLSLQTLHQNPKSFNAMRGLGLECYQDQEWLCAEGYYQKAIECKEGRDLVLSDYAMAGKVGVARYIFEGRKDEAHVLKTVGFLREASGTWNYLQGRATHDFAYMLWWTGDREESVNAFIGVLNHIHMFPTLSTREKAMIFNNAGCGVMLGRNNAKESIELFMEGMKNLGIGEEAWFIYMHNLVVGLVRDGREEEALMMLKKIKEVGGTEEGGEYRSEDGMVDTGAMVDECIWDYVK